MEPPRGVLASLWNFIYFLPFFIALLLLGTIKGIIFFPLICLFLSVGNSAIILGLWPLHVVWTYYSILSAKQLGPVLKLVLCILLPVPVILWPVVGIIGSFFGGALYGFLSPIFATFDAVGEGKTNVVFHCFYDGTWDTITKSWMVVRDVGDYCFHSYFAYMHDLRKPGAPDAKYYEIRLLYIPGAVIAALIGVVVDFPMISFIALWKSPYMLFKGWHRLFHDLIGREGPFLETICVPLAGLAILLWPLAVVGAVLGSMVSSIGLGAFAGVVAYQESSFVFGLHYVIASLAIYDEYSNDILDMPEGSCFHRPKYRKDELTKTTSRTDSTSESSVRKPPSRTNSIGHPMVDLKPLEMLDNLFKESHRVGELFVSEGLITQKDIEDAKSGKGSKVVSIGLPAYCILQILLRSAKANCVGILLRDNVTEITSTNRPKDAFFDWFFNPFLIIKDQLKASNLSEAEEDYLCKLVLLNGGPERLKSLNISPPPESERRRAELDGIARRLQGIMKSISRYPTARRNFQSLVKTLSEELTKINGETRSSNGHRPMQRSKSAFARVMFTQRSFKNKASFNDSSDQETEPVVVRNVDIV